MRISNGTLLYIMHLPTVAHDTPKKNDVRQGCTSLTYTQGKQVTSWTRHEQDLACFQCISHFDLHHSKVQLCPPMLL